MDPHVLQKVSNGHYIETHFALILDDAISALLRLQKQVSTTHECLPNTSSQQQQVNCDQRVEETGQAHIYDEINEMSRESCQLNPRNPGTVVPSLHDSTKTSETTEPVSSRS